MFQILYPLYNKLNNCSRTYLIEQRNSDSNITPLNFKVQKPENMKGGRVKSWITGPN